MKTKLCFAQQFDISFKNQISFSLTFFFFTDVNVRLATTGRDVSKRPGASEATVGRGIPHWRCAITVT